MEPRRQRHLIGIHQDHVPPLSLMQLVDNLLGGLGELVRVRREEKAHHAGHIPGFVGHAAVAAACSRFTAKPPTRATSKDMPSNVQRIFVLIFMLGRLAYCFFSSSN